MREFLNSAVRLEVDTPVLQTIPGGLLPGLLLLITMHWIFLFICGLPMNCI